MLADSKRGASSLKQGLRLLMLPKMRIFLIGPLLINCLIFSVLIYFAYSQFSQWMAASLSWLPDWLNVLEWLLWPIFSLVLGFGLLFSFSSIANLLAAPFHGLLSEMCQRQLHQERGLPFNEEEVTLKSFMALIPRTLLRELGKILYFLPRALLIFILSWIPPLTLIAPFMWLIFGAWMLAVQYQDYPADNNRLAFKDLIRRLKSKRTQAYTFGGCLSLLMWVPLLNLLLMPVAVCAATWLWVEAEQEQLEAPRP